MKREIRCRAWLKAESKMCAVGIINFGTGAFLIGANPGADYFTSDGKSIVSAPTDGRFCNEGEYELMQFTGRKDKNGKEIYEGDILLSKSWGVNSRAISPYHIVEWNKIGWVAIGYNGQSKVNPPLDVKSDFEVIGNIYSNPELLKS